MRYLYRRQFELNGALRLLTFLAAGYLAISFIGWFNDELVPSWAKFMYLSILAILLQPR